MVEERRIHRRIFVESRKARTELDSVKVEAELILEKHERASANNE